MDEEKLAKIKEKTDVEHDRASSSGGNSSSSSSKQSKSEKSSKVGSEIDSTDAEL